MMTERIGFFVPSDYAKSGINKVVENLVDALACEGIYEQIDLIYIISQRKEIENYIIPIAQENCTGDEDIVENENRIHTQVFKVFLGCENNRKCYLQAVKAIKEIVKERKYTSVVFSGMEYGLSFYFALRSSDVHIYAWEHRNFSAGPKFRLEWIGKRLAVRKFDGVNCITKKDLQQYIDYKERHKGIAKLSQIYNLTKFTEAKATYNAKSRKIVSCGYLSNIKGYDFLVEVADKVLKVHPDWAWDIYGEGAERANIEKWIKERNLIGRLNLKGYVENVNDLYADYGMFALTSRAEGMGMVLIEAQLSHLPVVSFDIPCGPSDVIDNGVNGDLIEPFNTIKMAESISRLIEDERLRIEYSKHSLDKHGELKKDIIVNKWIELIDE